MKKIFFPGKLKDSVIFLNESIANIDKYLSDKKTLIITDKIVSGLYSDKFPAGDIFVVDNGEKQKDLKTVNDIYTYLLKNEFDRNSFILGIGGGSICDITGFAASTFMRGIRFGFVPTTLLAQVDASIGGKNGVNFNNFKNIIGTFNQPDFILSDHSLLKSLNEKEIRNGFAETIKHGLIKDRNLIHYITENRDELLKLKEPFFSKMIEMSVNVKLKIINIDELETGERKILNFGHTIGHAIEIKQALSHGEAISIGMVFSALLSYKSGLLNKKDMIIIKNMIGSYRLPVDLNENSKSLIKNIKKDKKKNKDKIDFILLNTIGEAIIREINFNELETVINDMC